MSGLVFRTSTRGSGGSGGGSYPNGSPATVTPRPVHLDIRDYGAVGNGTTDDSAAFTAAQAAVPAGSAGSVIFIPPAPVQWTITAGVNLVKSNVTWRGVGLASKIKSGGRTTVTAPFNALFSGDGSTALTGITFEHLWMLGRQDKPVSRGIRRDRTLDGQPNAAIGGNPGASAQSAIHLAGKAYTGGATVPEQSISDIDVRHCRFEDFTSLATIMRGVEGRCSFTDSSSINTYDIGFVQCDTVLFHDNLMDLSADNGVSISRANKRVSCVGNVVRDCGYSGLWVSGFADVDQQGVGVSQPGPDFFTIAGNTIEGVGNNAISLRDAPRYGSVVGNSISRVRRGPVDENATKNDEYANGIMITGFPFTAPTAPTQLASDIVISGNSIRDCSNSGVNIRGAARIHISDNGFSQIGSQFRANGTTAIATTDLDQNNAVTIRQQFTVSDVTVVDNDVHRGTAFTNRVVGISGSGGVTRLVRRGNKSFDTRVTDPDTAALTYSRTGESAAELQLRQTLANLGLVTDSTVA